MKGKEQSRRKDYQKSKRKVVLSVLALVICVAMLLGTTFAWFTDSVTSGRNKIVAGDLDIEVTHTSRLVTEEETIAGDTDLFQDVDLWEPGAVSWENFTVKNLGTLAFKYNFNLNVADKNNLNGHDLTEVIQVATVDGGIPENFSREDAKGLSYVPLEDFQKSGALNAPTATAASEEKYGVVLYWVPTDHDNDYNVNNGQKASDEKDHLFADFAIHVVATQNTVEKDSFDDQYDVNATFPMVSTSEYDPTLPTNFVGYDAENKPFIEATIPVGAQNIPEGTTEIEMITNRGTTPSGIQIISGDEPTTYDIQFYAVDASGSKTKLSNFETTVSVSLKTIVPDGSTLKSVYHNADALTAVSALPVGDGQYFYDATSKKLSIGSSTFSPFTFVVHGHAYTWTSNGDGTHDGTCPCGAEIKKEACDKAGTGGACSKCGYQPAVTVTIGTTTTPYNTLKDAFAAVNASSSDCTVTLGKDFTATDFPQPDYDYPVFNPTKGIAATLDLNGHSISGVGKNDGAYNAVIWAKAGTLTITNSSTTATSSIINNYTGSEAGYHNGIASRGTAVVNIGQSGVSCGNIIIKGDGLWDPDWHAYYGAGIHADDGDNQTGGHRVNIYCGTVTGVVAATTDIMKIMNDDWTYVDIYGGTFDGYIGSGEFGGKLIINGGSFTVPTDRVSYIKGCVVKGKTVTINGEEYTKS